ncbi:MAG: hypothetical protein QME60_01370 [Verrucomicrobiota bacterium]|nr:hypothetical protein [Verrucomicrobiota bacterium]
MRAQPNIQPRPAKTSASTPPTLTSRPAPQTVIEELHELIASNNDRDVAHQRRIEYLEGGLSQLAGLLNSLLPQDTLAANAKSRDALQKIAMRHADKIRP